MSSSFVGNDGRGGTFGRVCLGCLALGGGLAWTTPAGAIPCDEVTAPNKIFGVGASAITPTLRRLAVALESDGSAGRTTIFYADPNGCDGHADFLTRKSTRVFKYWVAGQSPVETDKTCDARVGGQPLDFGYLAHHRSFCQAGGLTEGVVELAAPVESLSLVTGLDSSESVISAEALYLLFGFGAAAQVSPWSDGNGVFPRSAESWPTQLLGLAIDVPAASFQWAAYAGAASPTGAVKSYSTDATKAAQALTYVATATADTHRDSVKQLAYQHYGQACGVYPDSTAGALDKRNVRAGKYALWTNGYFYSRTDASARVVSFLGWFDGTTGATGTEVEALAEVIRAGNVPQCAMAARRTSTLGALESFAPEKPCGCYFEQQASGQSACQACADDSACAGAAPRCNFGFCEAYRAPHAAEG